jgi:hypothetical protein
MGRPETAGRQHPLLPAMVVNQEASAVKKMVVSASPWAAKKWSTPLPSFYMAVIAARSSSERGRQPRFAGWPLAVASTERTMTASAVRAEKDVPDDHGQVRQ